MKNLLRAPSLRSQIVSWVLYDGANSAYSTIMVTAYYVLYFKSVVVGDPHKGDFLWGLSIAIAMAVLAFSSPLLGAIADVGGHRRKLMAVFTLLCVVCTLILANIGAGAVAAVMLFFILAEIGFEGGSIFYDSFVSQISHRSNVGRISGYGFAVGYAGGILSLLLALPFLRSWSTWPLVLTAGQFFLLSLPALLLLRDRPSDRGQTPALRDQVRLGFTNLRSVLAKRKEHPDLFRLLLSYLIFYDGIATVISFAAAYAFDTFGFTTSQIIWVMILSNTLAVPGALAGGWLCDRIGGRNTILATLALWMVTIVSVALTHSKPIFFLLTGLVGIGLGSTQGATRALYAHLVPKGNEGQFFALKGICGKFASILGPIMFGLISYLTKNQRLAAASLLVFFVVGFALVATIDEQRGKRSGAWSS